MEKEIVPHDAVFKDLYSIPDVIRSLLTDHVRLDFIEELDFSSLEPLPTNYITPELRQRFTDIVWKVSWKKKWNFFLALLLEFQSAPDEDMALRIHNYTGLLIEKLRKSGLVAASDPYPPVFPIVINKGPKVWTSAQSFAEKFPPMPEDLRAYAMGQRYFLIDESTIEASSLNRHSGLVSQIIRIQKSSK